MLEKAPYLKLWVHIFSEYFQVICILGETLQAFDEDGLIPAYGFGDKRTKGDTIFSLKQYVSDPVALPEQLILRIPRPGKL